MDSLSEYVLTAVVAYGAPAFGLALLVIAMGLPAPGTLLVLAVGAFVRQGFLDAPQTFAYALAGAVLGDTLSFSIGRLASGWTQRRFGASALWQRGQSAFDRYGAGSVYLTRFLITSLALPVNLIAGSSGFKPRRFVTFSFLGELTWLAIYGGLGYAFGSQWEVVSQAVTDFGGLLLGVLLLSGGIYLGLRMRRAARVRHEQQQGEGPEQQQPHGTA